MHVEQSLELGNLHHPQSVAARLSSVSPAAPGINTPDVLLWRCWLC